MKYLALVAACLLALGLASPATAEDIPDPTLAWHPESRYETVAPGSARTLMYSLSSVVPGMTLRWYLVPSGGDPAQSIASGEVDPETEGTVVVDVPVDLPHGAHYDVLLRATTDPDGQRTVDSDRAVLLVDSRAPQLRMRVRNETFYPLAKLEDWGVPSHTEYAIHINERATGTMTFTGPTGVVEQWDAEVDPSINGSFDDWYGSHRHDPYPEGRYEIRLDVVDAAGNPATAAAVVHLSYATLHRHEVTKVVPAARTLVRRSVGSCSSLTVPSSHHWKGSIGFASRSRCDRPRESGVTTLHRLYLPPSFQDGYSLHLWFYGASAASRPGSALAGGWVNRKGGIDYTNVARGGAQWTILPQVGPDVLEDRRGRHYVLWALGTTGGNRYDVKAFRYELSYSTFS